MSIVTVTLSPPVSRVQSETQPTLPTKQPKITQFPPKTTETQQPAMVCLYRHQQDAALCSCGA
eukprot:13302947-Ditylum_brightwellii.AAC.1